MPDWKTIEKTQVMETSPYHHASHKWHDSDKRLHVYDCLKNTPNTPKCPMCEVAFTEAVDPDAIISKRGKELRPSHDYLVNVYVISDLKCPENNGKVMILRMGKKLYDTYESAATGDFAEVYGDKIWRLGKGGCTFLLITEKGGVTADGKQYPSYEKSSFLPDAASDVDVAKLTEDDINEICGRVYELPALFPTPKVADLKKALDEHYYGSGEYVDSDDTTESAGVDSDEGEVRTAHTETTPGPNAETKTEPKAEPKKKVTKKAEVSNPEPPVEKPIVTDSAKLTNGAIADEEELNKLLGI
jgi:hypothetical protein